MRVYRCSSEDKGISKSRIRGWTVRIEEEIKKKKKIPYFFHVKVAHVYLYGKTDRQTDRQMYLTALSAGLKTRSLYPQQRSKTPPTSLLKRRSRYETKLMVRLYLKWFDHCEVTRSFSLLPSSHWLRFAEPVIVPSMDQIDTLENQ